MHFALGSKSDLKKRAVQQALEQLGFNRVGASGGEQQQTFVITTTEVSSGVPEQPFGRADILKGARNRARAALRHCKEADYGIGIESGLSPVGGGSYDYHDQPCVILMARGEPYRLVAIEWGATLTISSGMVAGIKNGDFPDLGALVKERGQKEKDPHKHLTGGVITRDSVMVPPLVTVLSAVKEELRRRRQMAA